MFSESVNQLPNPFGSKLLGDYCIYLIAISEPKESVGCASPMLCKNVCCDHTLVLC